MKKAASIVIGFLHDFAAGCWASTIFSVYWLDNRGIGYQLVDMLVELKRQFFFIGIICVLIVLLTGVGRSFTYVDNFYGNKNEKVRRNLLILKHFFLLIVFGSGTYWQYTMIY